MMVSGPLSGGSRPGEKIVGTPSNDRQAKSCILNPTD